MRKGKYTCPPLLTDRNFPHASEAVTLPDSGRNRDQSNATEPAVMSQLSQKQKIRHESSVGLEMGWCYTPCCQVNDKQECALKSFDTPGSFCRCQNSREPGHQPTGHIRHFQHFPLQSCRMRDQPILSDLNRSLQLAIIQRTNARQQRLRATGQSGVFDPSSAPYQRQHVSRIGDQQTSGHALHSGDR